MAAAGELSFLFVVEGVGAKQKVTISKPVRDMARPMWVCEISWEGPLNGPTKTYGATSFQSLSLAIDLIQSEMASKFGEHPIREAGAPWFSTVDLK